MSDDDNKNKRSNDVYVITEFFAIGFLASFAAWVML
jgi:hypothetical protein